MRANLHHRVFKAHWIVPSLILIALAGIAIRYRGHLFSAFGWVTEATGSKSYAALAILLALFILVCVIFWLVLPILLYLGLRDLRQRAAELAKAIERLEDPLTQKPPTKTAPAAGDTSTK